MGHFDFRAALKNMKDSLFGVAQSDSGKDSNCFNGRHCPYCGNPFNELPKRKRKCPNCSQIVYVKRGPNEQLKRLVTEEEASQVEKQWNEKSQKEFYTQLVNRLGISPPTFERTWLNWQKKVKSATIGDFVWSLLNEQLQKKASDSDAQIQIYRCMTSQLMHEEKDNFQVMHQVFELELLKEKKIGRVKKVEIRFSENCCGECKKIGGKVMAISKAIKEMPIPNKNCQLPFGSRCWGSYSYIIE